MSAASSPSDPGSRHLLREKRLAECYQRGIHLSSSEKNYDYAHEMLAECVLHSPDNLMFVEALLGNLRSKTPRARQKRLLNRGMSRALKQVIHQKDWPGVIRIAVESLKDDPWNVAILCSIAQACAHLHYNEVELAFLKQALEANPKDLQVNRHCALSLARMGQFDQAIACWHRIETIRAGDPEAARMIDQLGQEKLKYPGGKPPIVAKTSEARAVDFNSADVEIPVEEIVDLVLSPRQKLEQAIAADPRSPSNYVELAQLLIGCNQYQEAEAALLRGIANCGELPELRECLSDVRSARSQNELAIAESRRVESERYNRPIRVPWLETVLALAVIGLVLQLFPPVSTLTLRLVDVRHWPRGAWLIANLVVVAVLFVVRFFWNSDRRSRHRRVLHTNAKSRTR